MHITINEQAAELNDYKFRAGHLEEDILCHCSYFLVYDMPETDNHWKLDVYGLVKKIKIPTLKSGDKLKATQVALVEENHGEHFCENKENPKELFSIIYDSEDIPHDFDFDMSIEHNQDVYFDAIDKFYYEFLIPWISVPMKNPPREQLYQAIDKYLIERRADMV